MSWQKQLIALVLLCIFAQVHSQEYNYKFEGPFGEWQKPYINPDAFICGFSVQYQDYKKGMDNTAVNGISFIFCNQDNWNKQYEHWFTGAWGNWKTKYRCQSQEYVNSIQVRIQQKVKGDNTGLNGIRVTCKGLFGNEAQTLSYDGDNGDWSTLMKANDKKYEFFNGYAVQFQGKQGKGDDTAINGLQIFVKQWDRNKHRHQLSYEPAE